MLLSTQNRPVLERFNRIAPPAPGQGRQFLGRKQLAELLDRAGFDLLQMRVVTPLANRGLLCVVAKAGRILRLQPLLERCGFGWTIMARAARRP